MKTSLIKKIAAVAATGLLLTSLGASAADTHKCKAGEKWDAKTSTCVKSK